MGKAVIKSETGKGLYVVTVIYKTDVISAKLVDAALQSTKIADILVKKEADLARAQSKLDGIISYMYSLVGVESKKQVLTDTLTRAQSVRLSIDVLSAEITRLKVDQLSNKYKKNRLQADISRYKNPLPVNAWCVDYTEGLTGTIDTIELNDEVNAPNDEPVILSPTPLSNVRGLTPVGNLFRYTFIYLYIQLPVYQNLLPEYREAIISFIDDITSNVNVTFNSKQYISSMTGQNGATIDINQSVSINNVPVVYKNCGILAFKVGDRVVLEFNRNWNAPKIIGFVSHPVNCVGNILVSGVDAIKVFSVGRGIAAKVTSASVGIPAPLALRGGSIDWSDGVELVTWAEPLTISTITSSVGFGRYMINGTLLNDYNLRSIFYGGSTVYTLPNVDDVVIGSCVKKINNTLRFLIVHTVRTAFYQASTALQIQYSFVENGVIISSGSFIIDLPARFTLLNWSNQSDLYVGSCFSINKSMTEGGGSVNIGFYQAFVYECSIDMQAMSVSLTARVGNAIESVLYLIDTHGPVVGHINECHIGIDFDGDRKIYALARNTVTGYEYAVPYVSKDSLSIRHDYIEDGMVLQSNARTAEFIYHPYVSSLPVSLPTTDMRIGVHIDFYRGLLFANNMSYDLAALNASGFYSGEIGYRKDRFNNFVILIYDSYNGFTISAIVGNVINTKISESGVYDPPKIGAFFI